MLLTEEDMQDLILRGLNVNVECNIFSFQNLIGGAV
jgi:hypothetical protein